MTGDTISRLLIGGGGEKSSSEDPSSTSSFSMTGAQVSSCSTLFSLLSSLLGTGASYSSNAGNLSIPSSSPPVETGTLVVGGNVLTGPGDAGFDGLNFSRSNDEMEGEGTKGARFAPGGTNGLTDSSSSSDPRRSKAGFEGRDVPVRAGEGSRGAAARGGAERGGRDLTGGRRGRGGPCSPSPVNSRRIGCAGTGASIGATAEGREGEEEGKVGDDRLLL